MSDREEAEAKECHDRNHEGLDDLVRGWRFVAGFGGPLPWMGQDVALLAHAVKDWLAQARAEGKREGLEAAAKYLDGAAQTWHEDIQPDRADDADNYAHHVRALLPPEPAPKEGEPKG